jgi:hypothetical protein
MILLLLSAVVRSSPGEGRRAFPEKSFAEFFCRSRKTDFSYFFAGSAGEKIPLSQALCPKGAANGCNPHF